MLAIRLARTGKINEPSFRIIVTEKSRDNYGKFLEILGHHNPKTKKSDVKAERIQYWLSKGAQASPTVNNLLVTLGVIKGEKVRASKSKPGKKKQVALAAQKPVAAVKPEAAAAEPKAEVKKEEKPAEKKETKPEEKKEEKPAEKKEAKKEENPVK